MSTADENRGTGAHILLFPMQTSGHIIPFLDLAHQLIIRGLKITVIVTPTTLPLLQGKTTASLQPLVLPIPTGPLPPPSLAAPVRATAAVHGPIVEWFKSHPSPPVAILSDFFLGWTQRLASELGIPRIVFWAGGGLASAILHTLWENIRDPLVDVKDDKSPAFSFPNLPHSPEFSHREIGGFSVLYEEGDPDWEFLRDGFLMNKESWGAVFNSFKELDGIYIDFVNREMGGHNRVWAVGPLLPSRDDQSAAMNRGGSGDSPVLTWLDRQPAGSVVYVCLGTRVVLNREQVNALGAAVERSGVNFIWCVKAAESGHIPAGFERRVGERGVLVKGWAPQLAILRHAAVGAFLSHCGWNSALEGIATGVTVLTWPVDADQLVNARFFVDGVGVAIRACVGCHDTIPDVSELSEILVDSVKTDNPRKERVRMFADAAAKAVGDGGSSTKDLDSLAQHLNHLTTSN